ncbi:MAG: GDSL-type esterase/lipase family protein [Opitutaceae bacterium]|nr:GDSL-type esterase/lipase family protein [Opitutaceae bacterium]
MPLLGISLICAAAAFAQPAAIPTERNIWLEVHKRQIAKAGQNGADIMFVGDSITAGWDTNGAKVWARHMAPRRAANFGISGDKTEHVLWRLQNGALSEKIRPKVVVLMIGTNNILRDDAQGIADGISAIIKEIHLRAPSAKVLLMGIFPRSEKPDAANRGKVAAVNKIISQFENGRDVAYLDIGGKFIQPDGTINREIMYDFLHLTHAGYQLWADAIDDKLSALLE